MGTKRRPRSSAHRGGPRGRCRGCGADVYWLTCVKADGTHGAKAPIDVLPSFEGNIEVDVAVGLYRVVPKDAAREHRDACDAGSPPRLRLNHFVTCTNVTYRKMRGRMHSPSADELDAADAWEADRAATAAGIDLPTQPAGPVAPVIALPTPGEFLVDPEEAEAEPDE